jgi:hypothetical protein
MMSLLSLCRRIYALLVRLYPSSFRAEFDDEMQSVFAAKLSDAARSGTIPTIAVCLQELRDLPGNLLLEYGRALAHKKGEYAGMDILHWRLHTIGLVVPLGLVGLLLVVNPRYLLLLMTDMLGWLIIIGFALTIALNTLRQFLRPTLALAGELSSRQSPISMGYGSIAITIALSLFSVGSILLGPAAIRVSAAVPSPTLKSIFFTVYGVLDVCFAVAIVVIVAKLRRFSTER